MSIQAQQVSARASGFGPGAAFSVATIAATFALLLALAAVGVGLVEW